MAEKSIICHTTQARRRMIEMLFNYEVKKLLPESKHHLRRRDMIEEAVRVWDQRSFERVVDMLRKHV